MSENKIKVNSFTLIKTTPGKVMFFLHPISNPMITKLITLDSKKPSQVLPLDYALGIFADTEVYNLFKSKAFTISNVDVLVQEAFKQGVYFDEVIDFTPAKEDREEEILTILKNGERARILKLLDTQEEKDAVIGVAREHYGDLTQAVISLIEHNCKIQLVIDDDNAE